MDFPRSYTMFHQGFLFLYELNRLFLEVPLGNPGRSSTGNSSRRAAPRDSRIPQLISLSVPQENLPGISPRIPLKDPPQILLGFPPLWILFEIPAEINLGVPLEIFVVVALDFFFSRSCTANSGRRIP